MHYPRLTSLACGSFAAERFRDDRETAFCGIAGLYDVASNLPLPMAECPIFTLATPVYFAINDIIPKCRINGTDICTDECKALVRQFLEGPCVEVFGIRYMFDLTCSNCKCFILMTSSANRTCEATCDEFQNLLTHNCYGLCAYNLQSEHCPTPTGDIVSYNCVNHECVPNYVGTPVSTPISTPISTPVNSVRFNQRYGPAFYAMMSVVVAIGVAIAGFAVGFFIWKTVQNRELNYNANINY